MPTPVVKSMSKEAGVSVKTGEKRWQEAKKKTPPGSMITGLILWVFSNV